MSWTLLGRDAGAGRFECADDGVAAGLRPVLAQLPTTSAGAVRLALAVELPEALRRDGVWRWSAGGLLIDVTRG